MKTALTIWLNRRRYVRRLGYTRRTRRCARAYFDALIVAEALSESPDIDARDAALDRAIARNCDLRDALEAAKIR